MNILSWLQYKKVFPKSQELYFLKLHFDGMIYAYQDFLILEKIFLDFSKNID